MKITRHHRAFTAITLSLLLALSRSSVLSASEVYKSVDESGKVTYTDQPQTEAERVDVQEPNTVKAVTPAPPRKTFNEDAVEPTYEVSITSPTDQQLLMNRLASLTVTASVTPALKKGLSLRLILDGAVHSSSQGEFVVGPLSLGKHTLQVEVISSKDNRVLAQSGTITVFARQPG